MNNRKVIRNSRITSPAIRHMQEVVFGHVPDLNSDTCNDFLETLEKAEKKRLRKLKRNSMKG
jgi:hypothetical protein